MDVRRLPGAPSPEPRADKGFSLVELVISMAILAVGLVGAMRVFPIGLRASQRAEVRSRVGIVAQRTLESLKLKPCSELEEGEATAEGFAVTTRIVEPDLGPFVDPARLKAVEVMIGPAKDGGGAGVTFMTYFRCPPSP